MTAQEATADVFVRAFKSLPKAQRGLILARIAEDNSLRRDLADLAVFAKR